jgi:hypothetical protein
LRRIETALNGLECSTCNAVSRRARARDFMKSPVRLLTGLLAVPGLLTATTFQ